MTQAEETEQLLMREIDHRAKNVLAVVQSPGAPDAVRRQGPVRRRPVRPHRLAGPLA